MENKNLVINNRIIGKDLVRYFILLYWILFWLLNVIDKIIGGAHFLFVGKDRFAQVERFFDSLGLGNPIIANVALIITAGLEIFALVFFSGALYHFIKKNIDSARSWFFIGIVLTLTTFTYFSLGDQVFGDHFELLEHGLFWFITLLSWIIFIRIDKIQIFDNFSIGKKQFFVSAVFTIVITATTTFAIFWHNHSSFIERTQAVDAIKITENKYKIKFPFLAGSKAFENSIAKFKEDNPSLSINYIYTAPTPLRLAESDGLIIYIQTDSIK
ncbi:MAG: hypothetical protein SGJ10_14105 [Bacteroidota bacterium]|nr:hypothetical protein [Bacteroidota bacterium]